MAHQSPLRHRTEHAGLPTIPFQDPQNPTLNADITLTFGAPEAEYAAFRKGAALLDRPDRAALAFTGADHTDFLNRLLTQELMPKGQPLPPYTNTAAFWLNRKGRIDADLRLTTIPHTEGLPGLPTPNTSHASATIADLDIIAAPHTATTLDAFLFAEDAAIHDTTTATHRFQLHGPTSARLLADLAEPHPHHPDAPPIDTIANRRSTVVKIAGKTAVIDRDDQTADLGLHILVGLEDAETVFDAIAQHARDEFGHHNNPETDNYKLRHAGWHAFNTARLEAATPLFRIDFSTNNLPAETALLEKRVSFTKGCYLGQEVVARMHSLGKPKQQLVPITINTPPINANNNDTIPADPPEPGTSIYPGQHNPGDPIPDLESTKPIGAVTSAANSPMLAGRTIALAQIKTDHAKPGTPLLLLTAPDTLTPAAVHDEPTFWSRA